MGFLIINALPNETINSFNIRFNLNLVKILSKGETIFPVIDEFEKTKKMMETNKPVEYECNKY